MFHSLLAGVRTSLGPRRKRRAGRSRRRGNRPGVEVLETRDLLHGLALTPLVPVSGASPFAGCTADGVAGQSGTNVLNSEVEPWIAVHPSNPSLLVAAWQQDRWSNGGAA